MRISRRLVGAALVPMALAAASCAGSGGDPGFFRGKTVRVIVPHGPGSMDTYARAIAPYLQKYLPGSKVEVSNLPGDGGTEGRNLVYGAKPDGLTLGITTGGGVLLAEWAGYPGVRYRSAGFAWIGRISFEAPVMVVSPGSGFRTIADIVKAGKIRMGIAGVGSDDYYMSLVTARILGYEVEANTGFTGTSDASLACVRGEVDAIMFPVSGILPQVKAGTLLPLVCMGGATSPALPGVPAILELIPEDQRALMEAFYQIYALERVFLGPPGLPPRRLTALRDALDQAMADPELLRNLTVLNRPVDYLSGTATSGLVAGIMAQESRLRPLVADIAWETR